MKIRDNVSININSNNLKSDLILINFNSAWSLVTGRSKVPINYYKVHGVGACGIKLVLANAIKYKIFIMDRWLLKLHPKTKAPDQNQPSTSSLIPEAAESQSSHSDIINKVY